MRVVPMNGKLTWAVVDGSLRIFHDGVLLTILSGGRLARLAQDAVEAALHDAGKRP